MLRHGDAEDGPPDDERRLTPEGEEQARQAGAAMRELGARPELVLTSPKARAVRTAELAAEALGGVAVSTDERLRGGRFDARGLAAGLDEVLLVGHEPDISNAIHDLTAESVEVKKGYFAAVDGRDLRVPPRAG